MDSRQPKRRGKRSKGKGAEDAAGVSEFTQLALYMAATVAGMVTALLVARRPFFESLMRRVGQDPAGGGKRAKRVASRPRSKAALPSAEQSLPMLAEAIVGNTKAAVASVFGPPRSAALRGVVRAGFGAGNAYWHASTWYYPLPRSGALAMAIEFDDDAARRVEFFHAPGV
jgi:hypothetical protein